MEWYISRLGNTYGPLTFDDLISRARDGRLVKDDLVWSVGMKKWEISEGIAGLWLPPAPPSAVMPTPPVDTPPKPLPPPIPEPTESIFAPSIEFPKTSKSPNFILRFWRGDVRLPVAYWVVGFLFTIAIMGLSNAFGALVESLSLSRAQGGIVLALFLLFIVACTAWQLVGIWRSAGNYIKRSKTPFWGGFARVAVILGVIRAAVDFHTVIQPMLTESLKLAVGVEETPPYHLRLMHNGTEVELSGGMPFGTADALQKLLDAAPAVKLVHLNSMGGRIDEGYQIYKILHDKSLASYTSSGCMSACTIAFLGGNPRAERRPGQPVAVWLPYVQEAFLHSDFAVLAAIAPPRIGPGRPRKTEKTPGVGCPTFLIKSPGAQNPTFLEKPRAFAEKTPGVDPKNSGCLTPDCKSPLQLLPARTPGETRFRAKSPSASPNIFEGEVKDGVAHLEYALKGQSFGGRLTNEALASWREQLRQNAQVRSLIQDDAFELAKLARTHEKFWPAPAQLIAAVEARFSQSGEKPSEFAAFTWLTQDKLAAQAAKAEEQMRSLMLLASGGRR